MDEDSIGFSAKAPVSAWNKRIGVDYPGVFKALIKATIAYATGNAPAGLSAMVDGMFTFKLEDRPLPPAELAWLLIRRALAHAMARLSVEALAGRVFLGKESDTLIAALDRGLDDAEIWIDPAFFDRPADIPVLEAVRAQFDEWLREYLHLDEAKAASVHQRFGAYFTFALRREWAEHAEAYTPIDAELRRLQTPFAKSSARERAWLRNAAYLERQINEPVFDETFGLAHIYVPLRAWYLEAPNDPKAREGEEGTRERRRVVDLEQHLDAWFKSSNKKDAIRVICGGPGSGKTSSAKIWAARLAQAGNCVLFVPLHRLELRDERPNVQAALWEFLHDLDVLPFDPLDSGDGEPRLLILFDGLDELAMQGRAGQEAARSFVDAVERKLDLLNERKDRFVQVAFGGRDIAVQTARLPSHQVLHVLPYHGAEREFEDPDGLLKADRYTCQRWWQQFGRAVGEDYRGVPESLQDEHLAEITAQPLLNYLLALSFRRGELDFSTAPNLNLIYRDLLDAVYERRWGPGRHPTKKQLTCEEFGDLLDELGLAAWHGAGRTVTESQVEDACERAGLQEQLAAFQEGARGGAISLLAAFYFRQAGKIEGERTFEFTHKSFGEYLIARRLVRAIEDIHDDRELNRKNRHRGKTIEDALTRWAELTGPTALDFELLNFLTRQLALLDEDTANNWRMTFAELFGEQLHDGLPMHKLALSTYQEMARQARNAEETLLVAHFACASATRQPSPMRWPSWLALQDLLARLQQGAPSPRALVRRCLGWLGKAEMLPVHILDQARLSGANLESVDFESAYLEMAQLNGAILRGAILRDAVLWRANLEMADLERADLRGANLGRANLDGANLASANLAGVHLNEANLVGVRGVDEIQGLGEVRNWAGAKIDRACVERLGLDAEKLNLVVLDDPDIE